MNNIKYIGISKATSNIGRRIGFMCPVGTYVNGCNRSDLDHLYEDMYCNLVHDDTFIESDLRIYKNTITNEFNYELIK